MVGTNRAITKLIGANHPVHKSPEDLTRMNQWEDPSTTLEGVITFQALKSIHLLIVHAIPHLHIMIMTSATSCTKLRTLVFKWEKYNMAYALTSGIPRVGNKTMRFGSRRLEVS